MEAAKSLNGLLAPEKKKLGNIPNKLSGVFELFVLITCYPPKKPDYRVLPIINGDVFFLINIPSTCKNYDTL